MATSSMMPWPIVIEPVANLGHAAASCRLTSHAAISGWLQNESAADGRRNANIRRHPSTNASETRL